MPIREAWALPIASNEFMSSSLNTPNRTHVLGSTKQLGNSDLQLTAIGFGAWAIGGGDWQFAWGPQEDKESIEAIHRALDAGVNWIDTAAVYGLGHSEEVVGSALKSASAKPYIFTKCAMTWGEDRKIVQTLKKIRQEVEGSLRLGLRNADRRNAGGVARSGESRQGPLHRRIELQRLANGARTEDCADHLAPAALLDDQPLE